MQCNPRDLVIVTKVFRRKCQIHGLVSPEVQGVPDNNIQGVPDNNLQGVPDNNLQGVPPGEEEDYDYLLRQSCKYKNKIFEYFYRYFRTNCLLGESQ